VTDYIATDDFPTVESRVLQNPFEKKFARKREKYSNATNDNDEDLKMQIHRIIPLQFAEQLATDIDEHPFAAAKGEMSGW
jgi:hypothetical protein